MKTYALMAGDTVANLVTLPYEPQVPGTWVEVPEDVAIGWVHQEDGSFVAPQTSSRLQPITKHAFISRLGTQLAAKLKLAMLVKPTDNEATILQKLELQADYELLMSKEYVPLNSQKLQDRLRPLLSQEEYYRVFSAVVESEERWGGVL